MIILESRHRYRYADFVSASHLSLSRLDLVRADDSGTYAY